jgi:HD superfamily phosphohydrolase
MNRNKKILNDPVYGFINLPDGLLAEILHHGYFQRLRRVRQLGMSDLVYPGATHTRFLHTLGSYHLMNIAISVLREKGIQITNDNALKQFGLLYYYMTLAMGHFHTHWKT